MVLRLRLSRVSTPTGAKRHKPFYNIVLAHARTARDSKPLEVLGTYDPIPQTPIGAKKGDRKVKDIKIDVTRARYWLGVGAQPSDTVWRLLSMVGLLEPKYLPTGQQTENALRAVRFPTHKPKEQKGVDGGAVLDAAITHAMKNGMNGGKDKEETRIGAGTTSPTNPNEA